MATKSRVDFIAQKKNCLINPYPWAYCLFCKSVFGNSNLAPGHLKNIWNHSTILIKISRNVLYAAEGGILWMQQGILWGISRKSLPATFIF